MSSSSSVQAAVPLSGQGLTNAYRTKISVTFCNWLPIAKVRLSAWIITQPPVSNYGHYENVMRKSLTLWLLFWQSRVAATLYSWHSAKLQLL